MIFPKIAVVTNCIETALTYVRDYSKQYQVMVLMPTKFFSFDSDVDIVSQFRSAGVDLFLWSDVAERIVVRYRKPRKQLCYYYLTTDVRGCIAVYSVLYSAVDDFVDFVSSNPDISVYSRISRKSAYGFAAIAGKSPDKYFIFYPPAT